MSSFELAAPKYVSVITLAELSFGLKLAGHFAGGTAPKLDALLEQARQHTPLDVTRHTAEQYAELKALLAAAYLAKALRRDRPRWVENWVDKSTGQTLQVDENDLWMCAQARERDLVLVTADKRMARISDADPSVRLLIV